jgi:hypothetical protein
MFSFVEFHNLLKIPVLIDHFVEHNQQGREINFWSFIKLHYFDPFVVDDDYQEDRQLPFRDTDCGLVVSISICEFSPVVISIQPPAEPAREFHHFNDGHAPQFTSFDIFQPPRALA